MAGLRAGRLVENPYQSSSHHHHQHHHPVSRLNGSEDSDEGSPLSPGGTSTPPLSPSQAAKDGLPDTPTRKNKRKLSEPRKRRGGSDFSIKRLRPGSPAGDEDDDGDMSDSDEDNNNRVLLPTSGKPPPAAASSHREKDASSSNRRHPRDGPISAGSRAAPRKKVGPRGDRRNSSSRGPSEREDTPALRGPPGGSLSAHGLHLRPVTHHPFFPAGLPPSAAALAFVPGFYLGPDGRPAGFPPPPFPGLPLGLPHHPLTFTAAAAATASLPGAEPPLRHAGRDANVAGHHPYGSGHPVGRAGSEGLRVQDPSSSSSCRAEPPDDSGDDDDDNNNNNNGSSSDDEDDDGSGVGGRRPRKNYKNMTRERRVEANARERTRVHTISAAFDALRRAVPSYSYNQKLSKLAILRIACTYIMALARLADVDCSAEPSVPLTFSDCVDLCTRTIQTEGRARRRH